MVGIGQPYSLAFRRLMNWRLEPKEELGSDRMRLCRKAGWQREGGLARRLGRLSNCLRLEFPFPDYRPSAAVGKSRDCPLRGAGAHESRSDCPIACALSAPCEPRQSTRVGVDGVW